MTLAKKDIRHLEWIYDRMKSVHNENVNFDYMLTFLKIIGKLHEEYIQEHQIKQPNLPAPNTVMWWLCRIADDEIRRKAVGNCLEQDMDDIRASKIETDVNEAIYSGWLWAVENGGYWNRIAKSEIPLLPEPEWKEYLELRK